MFERSAFGVVNIFDITIQVRWRTLFSIRQLASSIGSASDLINTCFHTQSSHPVFTPRVGRHPQRPKSPRATAQVWTCMYENECTRQDQILCLHRHPPCACALLLSTLLTTPGFVLDKEGNVVTNYHVLQVWRFQSLWGCNTTCPDCRSHMKTSTPFLRHHNIHNSRLRLFSRAWAGTLTGKEWLGSHFLGPTECSRPLMAFWWVIIPWVS